MVFILQKTLIFSIPLLIVALAGMFAERSGIINIAIDGIMIFGAFIGAVAALNLRQNIVFFVEHPQALFLICMAVAALIFMGRTDLGKDNDTFWAHAPQVLNMYRFSDIGNVGNRSKYYMLLYTAPVYTSRTAQKGWKKDRAAVSDPDNTAVSDRFFDGLYAGYSRCRSDGIRDTYDDPYVPERKTV